MGNKHKPERLPRVLCTRGPYRNAYVSDGDARPLVNPWDRRAIPRSQKSKKRVRALNRAFGKFYTVAEESASGNRHNTRYDLNRVSVYELQTVRLRAKYPQHLKACSSIMDVGCGTGKLDRRIVRTAAIMDLLGEGRKMSMLGIDYNPQALNAAMAKKDIMFSHHPGLESSLQMEYLLLDLKDLPALDLSKTCIGKDKVDLVLASDIFRWLPVAERVRVLDAIRQKMNPEGRLISMEFRHPPLIMNGHLSQRLALKLAGFGFAEPFWLNKFYEGMRDRGFEMAPDSKIRALGEEHDGFPLLVSCVFRPI